MVDYKGGGCCLCGYDGCLQALDFHHLDPAKKRFTIAGGHTRSWASLRTELDKCMLVCSNCHIELEPGVDEGSARPTADHNSHDRTAANLSSLRSSVRL
jgi:hypothetical protein